MMRWLCLRLGGKPAKPPPPPQATKTQRKVAENCKREGNSGWRRDIAVKQTPSATAVAASALLTSSLDRLTFVPSSRFLFVVAGMKLWWWRRLVVMYSWLFRRWAGLLAGWLKDNNYAEASHNKYGKFLLQPPFSNLYHFSISRWS